MDWNEIEGDWERYRGNIREQWGNLTEADLDEINGSRDILELKIQQRYRLKIEQIKLDIDTWYDTIRNHNR